MLDEKGNAALHYAAKHNRINVAQFLIDLGANINLTGEDKMTPLHFASRYGDIKCKEIIEYFIEKDADVNAKDK